MIGIDRIAPIHNSNRLRFGVGSEHGSALYPLTSLISPALRRDVACPTLFRQAKRASKHRVSQKTIERLSDEGLLRWGNASRTFVVLTERGRTPKGD